MNTQTKNICQLVSDSILVEFFEVFAFNCSPDRSLECNEIFFESCISEKDSSLDVRVYVSGLSGVSGCIIEILTNVLGKLCYVSTDIYGNISLLFSSTIAKSRNK